MQREQLITKSVSLMIVFFFHSLVHFECNGENQKKEYLYFDQGFSVSCSVKTNFRMRSMIGLHIHNSLCIFAKRNALHFTHRAFVCRKSANWFDAVVAWLTFVDLLLLCEWWRFKRVKKSNNNHKIYEKLIYRSNEFEAMCWFDIWNRRAVIFLRIKKWRNPFRSSKKWIICIRSFCVCVYLCVGAIKDHYSRWF